MFVLRTRTASSRCGLHALQWAMRTYTYKASSDYQTMRDIKKKLMKILNIEYGYSPVPKPKVHLMKYLPKSQKELPMRKMKDSYDTALIPLSSDGELKEKYVTHQGSVRIGRLIEDVDTFAVWCCAKHLIPPEEKGRPFPYNIVTILIDRIDILKSLYKSSGDIRLSGHVSWVGTSSIEVSISLDESEDGEWKRVTDAVLLMAVRNPLNTGAAIANPLEAETPEEIELMRRGEERKRRRQQMKSESILKKIPTEEELQIIHNLFMKTLDSNDFFLGKRVLPPKSKWMTDANLNNLVFCHPEFKNLHNKIFGGFLARQALELSWLAGFLYGKNFPRLIKISDIGFFHPVDVGSLVKFNSSITYTEAEYFQVFVFAEVFTGSAFSEKRNTTSFNFTYHVAKPCDTIYPLTYLEAMKYIEGRRNFYDEPRVPEGNTQQNSW